jgi:hypothetical protein
VKVKETSDLNERRSLRYQMMQGTKGNPVEGSGSPEEQRPLENPRIIERSEGNQIWRGRYSLFDLPGLSRVSSRVQANENAAEEGDGRFSRGGTAIDGVGKIEGPCVEVVEEEKAKGVTVAQLGFGMTLLRDGV